MHTNCARLMAMAVLLLPSTLAAQPGAGPLQAPPARVEANVIYGMHSGLALLMDVHYPHESNGRGILILGGTGWHLPVSYGGFGQKDRTTAGGYEPLLEAGYTLFHLNHRAAPRFRFPAPLEDVQRAARFIRFHAGRFGIDGTRLGGWGFSSGAHLIALLGVLDGAGDPEDGDAVNRESAKLQCVVAGALPADLTRRLTPMGDAAVTSLLGAPPGSFGPLLEDRLTIGAARAASPVHHVSPDDAPFLLEHGDADEIIPFEQAGAMEQALRAAGVPVQLRRVVGGDHGGRRFAAQDPAERFGAIVGWFDRHLAVRR
jgi:acetyl esterase/lipase